MPVTIDVIIPSFRLNPETLLPILNLERPADAHIRFYLISDNPAVIPHQSITRLIDDQNIFLIINEVNEGASATRNKGIENSQGDWVLFLDDDIEVSPDLLITYANAITQNPGEIGFIGLVNMPPPPTPFAHLIIMSQFMFIFTVAGEKPSFAWGATANIMISRKAIGKVRFSDKYPKAGGGEDVDFFLRARELNNFKNYKCLESARVTHPWWGNGEPDFLRFYRYGKGNSFLGERNKKYRWYDFLNTSEILLLAILVLLITIANHRANMAVLLFIPAALLIEYIINIIRCYNETGKLNLVIAYNLMLLRNIYELGILVGNLLRLRITGIGERFNFDGSIKPHHFILNRLKIIKLCLMLIAVILIIMFVYS